MKLELQLLIIDQQGMGNEVSTTTTDQQGTTTDQQGMKLEQSIDNRKSEQQMKLERQLLIKGLEVRTTTIDQQRMKLEQHLLINRAWS